MFVQLRGFAESDFWNTCTNETSWKQERELQDKTTKNVPA